MKFARCRISGIGEFVKEWKRSSAASTRFVLGSGRRAAELEESRFETEVEF
jgi:hypothetical protein